MTNNYATATVIHTYKHDATNAGASIVVSDNIGLSQTFYYWVSAVDTIGLESALTAAQSAGVNPALTAYGSGSGKNAVANPSFESNIMNAVLDAAVVASQPVVDYWTLFDTNSFQAVFIDGSGSHSGSINLLVRCIVGGVSLPSDNVYRESRVLSAPIPVKPGDVYKLSGYRNFIVGATIPSGAVCQGRLGVLYFDNNMNDIGEDVVGADYTASTGGWTYASQQFTVASTYSGKSPSFMRVQCSGFVKNNSGSTWTTSGPDFVDCRFDDLSVVFVQNLDDEVNDGTTYLRTSKNANKGGYLVVNSPVNVTNVMTSPTGSNTFPTGQPCFISGQAYSQGNIIDIYLDAGSNTGYMFRVDCRSGLNIGQILKVTNITSSGWAVIGNTYGSTNPAALTQWTEFEIFVGNGGYMQLWINKTLAADATDTSYTLNGNIKYGYEGASGKLGPGIVKLAGSTNLNGQASLASLSGYTFSYSSTTTSITWSWGAFTIYFPDGSTVSVGSGSQAAFTGLSASNTYYFGMYYDTISGTPVVVKSDVSSGTAAESNSQVISVINGDTHVPININVTAATPASGSGGGSGGGGHNLCFSPNTRIITKRGNVRFDELQAGDEVFTANNTWRKVSGVIKSHYQGAVVDMRQR